MKIAIIETGGKQYIVSEGKKVKIEKLEGEKGSKVIFDKVLLTGDDVDGKTEIGRPYLEGVSVEGDLIDTTRSKKVIVFRYKPKTRYKKKNTHRQWFSEVLIKKI